MGAGEGRVFRQGNLGMSPPPRENFEHFKYTYVHLEPFGYKEGFTPIPPCF